MKNFKDIKKEILLDLETKKEYKALELETSIAKQIIKKRLELKMTQSDLAKKTGTKQSAISRLESGTYNPSVAFLNQIACALNSKLKIQI
jgi:predicted transcriptional regulator